ALQDHPRQVVLLDPVEARQIPMQEARQPPATTADGRRGNLGIGQQGLRRRVFEHGHPCHSWLSAPSTERRSGSIPPHEKRLQSNYDATWVDGQIKVRNRRGSTAQIVRQQ